VKPVGHENDRGGNAGGRSAKSEWPKLPAGLLGLEQIMESTLTPEVSVSSDGKLIAFVVHIRGQNVPCSIIPVTPVVSGCHSTKCASISGNWTLTTFPVYLRQYGCGAAMTRRRFRWKNFLADFFRRMLPAPDSDAAFDKLVKEGPSYSQK